MEYLHNKSEWYSYVWFTTSKFRNKNLVNRFTFENTKHMKRLSEVSTGETVIIHSFENDDIFIKLMEMGCIPGETIKVEQRAPLGDPISITVAGYNLSLRINEAEKILVEEIK